MFNQDTYLPTKEVNKINLVCYPTGCYSLDIFYTRTDTNFVKNDEKLHYSHYFKLEEATMFGKMELTLPEYLCNPTNLRKLADEIEKIQSCPIKSFKEIV